MIAFLTGTIAAKETHALLISVHGVGYRVFCTLTTLAEAKENTEITIYTYHHLREDDSALFGFLKPADLGFFEKLLSVSGIGPKSALDILEVSPALVHEAIETGDVNFLKTLKGIGKKTAERMILELRGNIDFLASDSGEQIPAEVVQALADLGFEKSLIYKAFKKLEKPFPPAEEMVKWFLQNHSF